MDPTRSDAKPPPLINGRRRVIIGLGLVAAVAVAGALPIVAPHLLKPTPVARFPPIATPDAAPWIGAAKPDVTVVVFTDYQCPVCRATDPALKRLLARDAKVRVVFRHTPVFGPVSDRAARLAITAAREGRYADFHWALMESQGPMTPERMPQIAAAAGLDWRRLAQETDANAVQLTDQLRHNARMAWSLGVTGTPAYLVGDRFIPGGLDDQRLEAAVREARDTQQPAGAS